MSKNKKQFGVWMDGQQAVVVGKVDETAPFTVIASVNNESNNANSNEHTSNNAEKGQQQKFFKSIAGHLTNAEELHVTGTGKAQEQFIHFLADTPQFKNVTSKESTANKMSEEKLVEYFEKELA